MASFAVWSISLDVKNKSGKLWQGNDIRGSYPGEVIYFFRPKSLALVE